MSGEVVNLNTFRKARARQEKEQYAHEQRLRFGRSKAKRKSDSIERQRHERQLDQAFHSRSSDEREPD